MIRFNRLHLSFGSLAASLVLSGLPVTMAQPPTPDGASETSLKAKNAATEAPATEKQDASPTRMAYANSEKPLMYRASLKVNLGDEKTNLEQNRLLIYHFDPDQGEGLSIRYECMKLPSQKDPARYYGERPSLFKLGPMGLQNMRRSAPAEISKTGEVIKVNYAVWLCGLPFDVGRLPFIQLSEESEWSADQPVTLGYMPNMGRYLQILPVSTKIGPPRNQYGRRGSDQKTPELVTMLEARYKAKPMNGDSVLISESYRIDGSKFSPKVELTGKGTVVFSKDNGVVRNLNRTIIVSLKTENQSITVPISLSLMEASPSDRAEYLKVKEEYEQRLAESRREREMLEDSLPASEDREAIIELLRTGDQKKIEMLASRIRGEAPKQDPELGLEMYRAVLRLPRLSYTLREIIKKTSPDLEKTTSILDKFSSSFDITLTGPIVPKEAALTRGQIVCYPYYSSWKAANFYGSVNEVLVLETRESTPKLIAIKRDTCRLPSESFLDPATTDQPAD